MSSVPIIVAHRGLHHEYPENSLAAFRAAWDAGIEWCECDVHLSSDGEPIVIHDDTLNRTTDGTGPIAQQTTASIQQRRLKRTNGEVSDEHLPTLTELLHVMPGACGLLLEIKPALAEQQLAGMQSFLHHRRVIVQSFHRQVAEGARLITPRTAWLTEQPVNTADLPRCEGINPRHDRVDAPLVQCLHEVKRSIAVWTPNGAAELLRMIDLGVDMIITDEPLLARQLIARGQ